MQIIPTLALYDYKVPVIMKQKKTKNFAFCPGKLRQNFLIFYRTCKQN